MDNRYDWGIYSGVSGIPWDRADKQINVRNQVLYMINRSLQMFKYEGLPDTIPPVELERLLQTNGWAGITKVNGDLYAFFGGLGGMPDAYYRPTQIVVANPFLKFNATLDIDKDIVLMRNDTMMMGLVPIYSKYCTMLNENEITMMLASISKRVNNLISVSDDNTAESAKTYLKKLEEGELGYIFESKLFDSLKTNPMGSGGHVSMKELVELHQYIKASMYNDIGLDANYNMKRERLNTSEVEMNSDNLYPFVDNMLESRRIALEQINEMFGTNITVEFNSSWEMRINQGEDIDTMDLDGDGKQDQEPEESSAIPTEDAEESTEEPEQEDEGTPTEEEDEAPEDDTEPAEEDTNDSDEEEQAETAAEDEKEEDK